MNSPSRADFLVESPAFVETLSVTEEATSDPRSTITQGGAILADGLERRYGGSHSSSTLKFNLGSVPAGGQISSATFSFTVALAISSLDSPSLNVDGFASDALASGVRDFSAAITTIGNSGIMADGATDLAFAFDVTTLVASFANNLTPEVGFLLSVPTDSNVLIYGNDPSNPAGFRPSLAITYAAGVPEPPSIALCGIAGASVLVLAWARRSRLDT